MIDDFATEAPTLPIVGDVALLPRVAMITAPRVSIEVVAIAVAVFAVVQSLVVLSMPELIWIGLLALVAQRHSLYDRGHDMVFARQRRRVAK